MLTKAYDIIKCGCRTKLYECHPDINLGEFVLFAHYIKERYNIHKLKDVEHKEPPWTDDEILQSCKFTNVRREHDRQSKALISRVSLNRALRGRIHTKIVNTIMFRAWNNYHTFDFFGLPKYSLELSEPLFKEIARKKLRRYQNTYPELYADRKWFSAAYNQGGMKSAWRNAVIGDNDTAEKEIVIRPFHLPVWLNREYDGLLADIAQAESQIECFNAIKRIRGFNDFMAYQIFVDLTYCPEFRFSENEFVVAGPGCMRGMDYLFDNENSMDGMTYEEALFWLRDNFAQLCKDANVEWKPKKVFSDLPEWDQCLNVMSLENCFCEFSKYRRIMEGDKPRQTYQFKGEHDYV